MWKLCLRFIFIIFLICFMALSIGIIYNINDIYYYLYICFADGLAIYAISICINYISEEYDKEYKEYENIETTDQLMNNITTDTKIDIK